MAAGATIHTFAVQLADVDRGVYEELALRVARHPSETDAFMVTRVLAYCLEFEEGIAFGEGISSTGEPAVVVRDLTGRTTSWIEVGAPDAARLHYGSMQAERAAVYTHRDPAKVAALWAGKRIHQAEKITLAQLRAGIHRCRCRRARATEHDDSVHHRTVALPGAERNHIELGHPRAVDRVGRGRALG